MSAFDAFIKNFLEQELAKKTSIQEFLFYKDASPQTLEKIFELQTYLIEKYNNNQDFKLWIDYGKEVMHSLHIYNTALMEDDQLHEMISNCKPI